MKNYRKSIKKILACMIDALKITDILLYMIGKRYHNNYIRIVNYHSTPQRTIDSFRKQLDWFSSRFEICGMDELEQFLNGTMAFRKKPGLIITFDDGFLDNYKVAWPVLKKEGFHAGFMVSTGLIGKEKYIQEGTECDYMTIEQLKDLIAEGNFVACHTYSHHRMKFCDTENVLEKEIYYANTTLQDYEIKPCR